MRRTSHWGPVSSAAAAALVCALIRLTGPAVCAEGTPISEHHLKAVFLYNFAKFVEWPQQALGPDGDPLVIGVLDLAVFDDAFDWLKDKLAQNRPLSIRECATIEAMGKCHILFLNGDDLLAKRILTELRDRPVLTVGESLGFTRWGGIINFHFDKGKIRFRVNRGAAKTAGLRISAQLLEIADQVEKEGP